MILWEAHACLPLHPQADFAPIDRLHAAGVNYVSINIGMDMNPLEQVMSVIGGFRTTIAAHPDRYVIASHVDDIERAAAAGKLAIGFDLEGAMPLLEQPAMVALYRDLGVRQMHFAYNRNNSVAGGCHDEEQGLTPLGRRMVAAVNEAGVLMDCSHTGRRASLEIMDASVQPVIFSHSNPLALVEHGRNVTDEQIRACAATGGVVCVSGVSGFLGTRTPTADDVARHAAYVAENGRRRACRCRSRHQLPPGRDRRHAAGRVRRVLLVAEKRGLRSRDRAHDLHADRNVGAARRGAAARRHERRRGGAGHGRQHDACRAAGLGLAPAPERMQRKLTVILSADVVGYSGLMERDEAGTLDAPQGEPQRDLRSAASPRTAAASSS